MRKILLFFIPFGTYLFSMAPGIVEGDSAELITTSHFLGVTHMGYPFYLLLGKTVSFLPFGSIPFRINILSAILVSGTTLFLYLIAQKLFGNSVITYLSCYFFPFLDSIWQQALSAEVYALHLFLSALWLFYLIQIFKGKYQSTETDFFSFQNHFIVLFLTGLSLGSHHFTLLWIIPYLFFQIGRSAKQRKILIQSIIQGLIFFFLGISIFIYVPIRASRKVVWNWNYADHFQSFIALITAKSFRSTVMHAMSLSERLERFYHYISTISIELGLVLIIFSILGFYLMRHRDFRLFLLWCSFMSIEIFYFLFLNEVPLKVTPFGLVTRLILILFTIEGLLYLNKFLINHNFRIANSLIMLLIFVLLVQSYLYGFSRNSLSKETLTRDFTFNIASTIHSNDVLICEKDEIFPLIYSQTIEHDFSNNILLHFLNFPTPTPWYSRFLRDLYPNFIFFQRYKKILYYPYSSILTLCKARKALVYTTFWDVMFSNIEAKQTQTGILYLISDRNKVINANEISLLKIWKLYRLPNEIKEFSPIQTKYSEAFFHIGEYYFKQGKTKQANDWWKSSIMNYPKDNNSYNHLLKPKLVD